MYALHLHLQFASILERKQRFPGSGYPGAGRARRECLVFGEKTSIPGRNVQPAIQELAVPRQNVWELAVPRRKCLGMGGRQFPDKMSGNWPFPDGMSGNWPFPDGKSGNWGAFLKVADFPSNLQDLGTFGSGGLSGIYIPEKQHTSRAW